MSHRVLNAIVLALALSFAASAGPVSGVSIASVSDQAVGYGWDLSAIHLVDGSGLTGDSHGSCYATNTCWQNGFGGAVPATIVFDLGATYDVTSMHIWNGYWANYQSGRSANQVEISTSSNLSAWTSQGTTYFAEAPTTDVSYTGFDETNLSWTGTRYVRFQIDSNWGGGDCGNCITLSEVQFSAGAGGQVPEPATFSLVAAALAGLLWRLRR